MLWINLDLFDESFMKEALNTDLTRRSNSWDSSNYNQDSNRVFKIGTQKSHILKYIFQKNTYEYDF